MLAEIYLWWAAQMRSLIPRGAGNPAGQPDALIIAIDSLPDAIGPGETPNGAILQRRGGRETRLQSLDSFTILPAAATQLPAGLRLPAGYALSRDVVLPLAVARNMREVIGFEMDRLTPFTPDELYWGISNIRPDRARGKLVLRLSFVLRTQVDGVLDLLKQKRLSLSHIETETGRIDLAPTHSRRNRSLQTGLFAVCALLTLACLAVPFLRQESALNTVAKIIIAQTPAAQRAAALRQQLAIAASGRAAIAAARRSGDALQVLATLTDALPDGTWLSDLTLKSGTLTMDGQSADAALLIGRLSTVSGLQNPSFTAPVIRTADGKADQFSLNVALGP